MLRSAQELMGYAIVATDGQVGEVADVYFDDHEWRVRYLVVETGASLKRRKMLIAPQSLDHPDWDRKQLPASITTEQVRNSPDIDTNKPVSRQHESLFLSHYRHPHYWEAAGPPAVRPSPLTQSVDRELSWSDEHYAMAVAAQGRQRTSGAAQAEQHLRSCKAISNYSVRSRDGDIGHIRGLLFDEEDWTIRYLVVQTGHWWLGHQILIAVQWIDEVSWLDARVTVDLPRQTLIDAPAYNPEQPVDRTQEIKLFEYFGRAGYWQCDAKHTGH